MDEVQKSPMTPSGRGYISYVMLNWLIRHYLLSFMRSSILGREADELLFRPPSYIESEKWLAVLLLLIILTTTSIFRYSLESFNKWYFYWLTISVGYSTLLPEQRKDMIMRWDLLLFVIGFSIYVPTLIIIQSIYIYLHPYLSTSRESPKFLNMLNILEYSAEFGLLFSLEGRYINQSSQTFCIRIMSFLGFLSFHAIPIYSVGMKMLSSFSQPHFLEMVPWYSGTSADLYKTIYNLMVSVNIFQGRFDLRVLQAAMNQQEKLLHDFSREKELWFDFMADTGDGGNSTYTVARLLAEPHIRCASHILKRGDLLLIGGDLAYPNPSKSTYEQRLFRPFKDALEPPGNYEEDPRDRHIPKCFVIPGNHDWFDGLRTFTKHICEKSWLGGWFMPQETTYFALKLPQRWWIFGLDLALDGDIDTYQFKFFSRIAREMIKENECVIVMTHQPDWLLDSYEGGADVDRENLSNLICKTLKERCKLRIAGDIHHYMRHSRVESNESIYAQHLLVNGCGGAFAHPTHVFGDFKESHGVSYECKASYPDKKTSRRLGFKNILNFKRENWQFDYVGAILYYMLAFSMFPQCELHHIFEVDSKLGFCFRTLWNAFIYMLEHSYISLGAVMLLLIVAYALAPSKVLWKKRVVMAILHVFAHLVAALNLMLALELGLEFLTHHKLSATTSGYEHSSHDQYQRYESLEISHFVHLNGTIRIDQTWYWSRKLYHWCDEIFMLILDGPKFIAVTRSNICKNGMASLSRFETIRYYGSVFFYFWPLSTFQVSYVFGCYLYMCVNWFNLHYDEAFSSLRIADYKGFTRFHIKPNGDLEVFTLGVDKVPRAWMENPKWKSEKQTNPKQLSHKRRFPSKWMAHPSYKDPLESVKIIDQFVIRRANRPASTSEIEEPTS